ncbi:hypothetical protein ACK8P5_26710 (plasmid) [Paenibacillus sp. EC2-1]|uniref:hypothetical protein n=1 Tax=Paenibacillus sp. EC2-1 TaxID=3388665 RepID=UPI003BEEF8DB
MSNSMKVKNRTTVVKAKMDAILRAIARDYRSGQITSPAMLQHRVFNDLNYFYASIGRPTFDPIFAWGPPYSSDHNNMMTQIQNDLFTLYEEVQLMTSDLQSNFEQVELERQSFENRLQRLNDTMKGIALNITESDRTIIFRDYFVDNDQYAKEMVKGVPAHLSAKEGLLTLAQVDAQTFNEYATITLQDGNGFPGNTHIVRSVGGSLKFDGEEGLHINLADVLDGNSDTWFEYEIIEPTGQAGLTTEGKGFEYKEPISWITTNQDPLRLSVFIEIDKAKTMNWLSLSPFIPSDKGSTPSKIEKIVISDGQGTIHTTGQEETFDAEKGYLFPRQKVKSVKIDLVQQTGYETTIGHVYFMQLNKSTTNVVDPIQKVGIRVHGTGPSITNLGVNYDTGSSKVVYPTIAYGATVDGEAEKKQSLFNLPATPNNVQAGLEQVDAWRYVIGLRDIDLASYQYQTESEYVSQPFISTTPLKEIELNIDAQVPDVFSSDEAWLEYYISVDKGQNWNPIHPRNTYQQNAITKYIVNSGAPKEARTDEIGYIESLTPVHEIQFRIVLKRPDDIKDSGYYTPIVYGYELYVTTQEEA